MKYKYFYKNMPLRLYCIKNNLPYTTILNRMYIKGMTLEQAVETKFNRHVCYVCSDGVPLVRKCKNRREYCAALYRIHWCGKTPDEALQGVKRGRKPQYFYKDKPIVEICGGCHSSWYQRTLNRVHKGLSMKTALYGSKRDIIYA